MYAAGNQANRHGNYEEAIKLLDEAIESGYLMGVELASAHFSRAFAHRSLGDYQMALADYNKAIEAQPSLAQDEYFYAARAEALIGLGELDQAMADVEAALKLSPDTASLIDIRGVIFHRKGSYKKADQDFRQALKINPNLWQAKADLAWMLATCPEAEFRDAKEAVALAESAAKVKPDYLTMDVLAAAYAESGRFEDAIKVLEIALEILNKFERVKLSEKLQPHLAAYRNNTPWRQPSDSIADSTKAAQP